AGDVFISTGLTTGNGIIFDGNVNVTSTNSAGNRGGQIVLLGRGSTVNWNTFAPTVSSGALGIPGITYTATAAGTANPSVATNITVSGFLPSTTSYSSGGYTSITGGNGI